MVTNLRVTGMVAVATVLVEVAEVGVEGLAEVALAALVVTRATRARANLVLAATVVPMASTEVLEAAMGTTTPTVGSQLTRRISRRPIPTATSIQQEGSTSSRPLRLRRMLLLLISRWPVTCSRPGSSLSRLPLVRSMAGLPRCSSNLVLETQVSSCLESKTWKATRL